MNGPGLSHELGISIFRNQIFWINGPFPAGQNDISLLKKPDGLLTKIPEGKLAVADKGYRGVPHAFTTRNALDSKSVKHFKSRVKARHETCNGRLKRFKILSETFRSTGEHRLQAHKAAFEACCVLVQYEIEHGKGLFLV